MRFLTFRHCIYFILIVTSYAVPQNANVTQTSILDNQMERNVEDVIVNDNSTDVLMKFSTPCETPNHDPGYCMEITKCPVLLKQLNNTKAATFLRESRCGPKNENKQKPKVCCGRYGYFKETVPPNINPLPKTCGQQKMMHRGRIVGGKEALLGEFPWLAKLIHKNRYNYKTYGCSGFLVHQKFVMTAAHCIKSRQNEVRGDVFQIALGDHNLSNKTDCSKGGKTCAEPVQYINIKDIIVHPQYNENKSNQYNDVALIYLKKGAKFTDFVQPICLLTDRNLHAPTYYISGWGKTEDEEYSFIKRKVDVPFFDFNDCKKLYLMQQMELKKSQICAGGEENKDSCSGDSGGPLMMTDNGTVWFAAGVVSFGVGCGREGWPGVYTNIPYFVNWVKEELFKKSLQNNRRRHTKSPRKPKK